MSGRRGHMSAIGKALSDAGVQYDIPETDTKSGDSAIYFRVNERNSNTFSRRDGFSGDCDPVNNCGIAHFFLDSRTHFGVYSW